MLITLQVLQDSSHGNKSLTDYALRSLGFLSKDHHFFWIRLVNFDALLQKCDVM